MVRDDDQPPAGTQYLETLLQRHFERLHFAVDLDAQRLKKLGQELRLVFFRGAGLHGLDQLRCGLDRCGFPCPDDAVGDFPRGLQLAPVSQQTRQRVGRIAVHDAGRRQRAPLVHAHVQRRFAPERETPLHGVEMVRRDAQIGQNAVHLLHLPQPQCPAQKAEVALDVVEPPVVGAVRARVAVLIEGVESPAGTQLFEDAARMAAPAESEVHVSARRVYGEQVDGLLQKDRCMILRHIRC